MDKMGKATVQKKKTYHKREIRNKTVEEVTRYKGIS
jgi:hypothetical protein